MLIKHVIRQEIMCSNRKNFGVPSDLIPLFHIEMLRPESAIFRSNGYLAATSRYPFIIPYLLYFIFQQFLIQAFQRHLYLPKSKLNSNRNKYCEKKKRKRTSNFPNFQYQLRGS